MDAAFLHYYLSSSSRTFVGQVVNLRPRPEGTRNRPGERSSPARVTNRPPQPGTAHLIRSRLAALRGRRVSRGRLAIGRADEKAG